VADLTTPLCRKLGITKPILQAPIAASTKLAIAVSQAGGLGILPITWRPTDSLKKALSRMQAVTDKPFGVNLVISLMEAEQHANLDAALEAGVPVISTFWGDPAPLVERIHDAGALVMHTVGSGEEARKAVDAGVDIMVAQGVEAGGHVWGKVATMVLTPAVVDAVPGTPVVAAGGIADGRGLAAVMALGAEAAWVGTRLLLAAENDAHPAYRAKVVEALETDTVLSEVFDGGWEAASHRCLDNDTLQAWHAAGEPAPGSRPGEGEIVGQDAAGTPVHRYSLENPDAGMTGDVTAMALYAGQSAGLVRQEAAAADIIDGMVDDAAAILKRLGSG
jgi:NAD(P)H-dependent flavin oxidoreductase YrpB (nitropropane dioxygenase family)